VFSTSLTAHTLGLTLCTGNNHVSKEEEEDNINDCVSRRETRLVHGVKMETARSTCR
jgi:hypothetical protein